jgi:hypothetical protein
VITATPSKTFKALKDTQSGSKASKAQRGSKGLKEAIGSKRRKGAGGLRNSGVFDELQKYNRCCIITTDFWCCIITTH